MTPAFALLILPAIESSVSVESKLTVADVADVPLPLETVKLPVPATPAVSLANVFDATVCAIAI